MIQVPALKTVSMEWLAQVRTWTWSSDRNEGSECAVAM